MKLTFDVPEKWSVGTLSNYVKNLKCKIKIQTLISRSRGEVEI